MRLCAGALAGTSHDILADDPQPPPVTPVVAPPVPRRRSRPRHPGHRDGKLPEAAYLVPSHSLSDTDFERKDADATRQRHSGRRVPGAEGCSKSSTLPAGSATATDALSVTPAAAAVKSRRLLRRISRCPGDRHPGCRIHRRSHGGISWELTHASSLSTCRRHDHARVGHDPHPADRRRGHRRVTCSGCWPCRRRRAGSSKPGDQRDCSTSLCCAASPPSGAARSRSCPCRCSLPGCVLCG